MATLVGVFSEHDQKFFPIAAKHQLDVEGQRRVLASPLRYCLGDDMLYVPSHDADAVGLSRLCWARIRSESFENFRDDDTREMRLNDRSLGEMIELGAWVGDRYRKRLREKGGRFVPVDSFVADELLKHLESHPEALPAVSHDEFERLCAELFVRRGFKVDLFRPSKDGGIDFLAVQDDGDDPVVFAVQCKQPEVRPDGSRRTVGRPVLQQVYGASQAWDLSGAALISGSTYSQEARSFARLKPAEMLLYDQSDLLSWIQTYRWNSDE